MCQSEINQKRPIELSGLLKIFLINQKIIVFSSDVRGMELPLWVGQFGSVPIFLGDKVKV